MKYLGLWSPGQRIFFEKFVKPSAPPSYIVNVPSLTYLTLTAKFNGIALVKERIARFFPIRKLQYVFPSYN